MNPENQTVNSIEKSAVKKTPILEFVESKNALSFDDAPYEPEGKIIHWKYHSSDPAGGATSRFLLNKKIGDLNYRLLLSESYGQGKYVFLFKTKEYGYATTNLNPESTSMLEKTIASFIESTNHHPESNITDICVDPADDSYSREEIEECLKQILRSSKNTLSEDELRDRYSSFKIFRLYKEIFNKNFRKNENKSRADARSRYFKMMFRKTLPNWEIKKDPDRSDDVFILSPKN